MKTTDKQKQPLLGMIAAFTEERKTLRLGMDYIDETLWYGVRINDRHFFLRTGHQAIDREEMPNTIFLPDGTVHGSPMSTTGIRRYLDGEVVDGARLLGNLSDFFGRYAKFEHDCLPMLLSVWALAGFAHMAFPTFPYIWVTSAKPGSGKSRVLELLSEVSFRAKPLLINPTPAVLFRTLHDSAGVTVIDEFEQADEDSQKALRSVLNSGFQRSAEVPRCVGENHQPKYFKTYGPKAFAGLARIPETLRTRSVPILMMPKTKDDNIVPFFPSDHEAQLQQWRDEAAIWALSNAAGLAAASKQRDRLAIPGFLTDRQIDYMATLFATAHVAGFGLTALRDFCRVLADAQGGAHQGQIERTIRALASWFPADVEEKKIFLSEAAEILAAAEAIYQPDERKAGELLRKIGLHVDQIRIGPETRKGATVTRPLIERLCAQFLRAPQQEEEQPIAA